MNSEDKADYLVRTASSMKEGECLRIDGIFFSEAFPSDYMTRFIDGRPPEDRFLEKLPGTNYGAYKLVRDTITGDFTLSRHPCGNKRVREDWDRRATA